CWITDLDITFTGRLRDGRIQDLVETPGRPAAKAQIRLALDGDDLVAMVDGSLHFAKAWGSGRGEGEAGILDLLKLRSLLQGTGTGAPRTCSRIPDRLRPGAAERGAPAAARPPADDRDRAGSSAPPPSAAGLPPGGRFRRAHARGPRARQPR